MRPGGLGSRLASSPVTHSTEEPTMNAKPTTISAGIVVSTGIVGGPKRIFIGGLS